ncbi:hypothetical protein [Desulfarculus baarsii]
MSYIYTAPQLNILPFLIVPTVMTDQESCMMIGPIELQNRCDDLVANIVNQASPFLCPLVTVSLWYQGFVIIAGSFLSDVEDGRTKRKGLYMLYGAAIRPEVFQYYESVCMDIFNRLNSYLECEFEFSFKQNTFDPVVERFQSKETGEKVDEGRAKKLLQEIESDYFIDNLMQKVRFPKMLTKSFPKIAFSRTKQKRPYFDIANASKFWMALDCEISAIFKSSNINSKNITTAA